MVYDKFLFVNRFSFNDALFEKIVGHGDDFRRLDYSRCERLEKRPRLRHDVISQFVKTSVPFVAVCETTVLVVPLSVGALKIIIPKPLHARRKIFRFFDGIFVFCHNYPSLFVISFTIYSPCDSNSERNLSASSAFLFLIAV